MKVRALWTATAAVALCTAVGGAAVSQGTAGAAKVTDPPGTTYVFTDKDLTRDGTIVNYDLPPVPPGPYAISLFAGLESADGAGPDNLACEVSGAAGPGRVLVMLTHFDGGTATFVSGASSMRVAADSTIRVICSAEHMQFSYGSAPLRITLTRLAKMTTQSIVPTHVS